MRDNSLENIYISTNELSIWIKDKYYPNKDLVSLDQILTDLENAYDDLEILQEKYEDFKKEVEENYKYTPQT